MKEKYFNRILGIGAILIILVEYVGNIIMYHLIQGAQMQATYTIYRDE